MKTLKFEGTSLDNLRKFPETARKAAGFELHAVQKGENPSDWKPMTSIGPGVREIRLNEEGQYRIIYITKRADEIHVLHAFQKKTKKTEKKDIDLAKNRYKGLLK